MHAYSIIAISLAAIASAQLTASDLEGGLLQLLTPLPGLDTTSISSAVYAAGTDLNAQYSIVEGALSSEKGILTSIAATASPDVQSSISSQLTSLDSQFTPVLSRLSAYGSAAAANSAYAASTASAAASYSAGLTNSASSIVTSTSAASISAASTTVTSTAASAANAKSSSTSSKSGMAAATAIPLAAIGGILGAVAML